MKKSLLALAILGATSMSAFAQSSVSIYGVIDAGMVSESGAAGHTSKLTSGVASESRIGFRGTEDIGNGLKAIFTLEAGVNVDNGTSAQNGGVSKGNATFGRQSFVGIQSDTYGTVTAGRQYSALYNTLQNVADPFALGMAGTAGNLFQLGDRSISNSVKYASPKVNGFSGDVTYGFGEVGGDNSASRTVAGSAGYDVGPLAVRVAYQNSNDAAGVNSVKTTLVASSYDFGLVKANAAYAVNKGVSADDSRDMLIGATVPYGTSKFLVSFVRKDDRSMFNHDADQFSVGYEYDLSKRTNVYSSIAKINNKNGAVYTVGNASDTGTGDRAVNVGVRHSF